MNTLHHTPYTLHSEIYPFGSGMSGRSFRGYRYGFQEQEGDSEIKDEGNSWNCKYRMHDSRLGRFFAVDPLASKYPWNSTYTFSENRVIDGVELEGLEYLSANDPNIDASGITANDDGTYSLALSSSLTVTASEMTEMDGQSYYKIGQHLYHNVYDGWTTSGTEGDRLTSWPTRPAYSELESKYLGSSVSTEQAWTTIGGKVLWNHKNNSSFQNSCAIRICHSFNESGNNISPLATEKKTGRAGTGSNKKWYYYGVNEFSSYLNRNYGNADFTFNVTSKMTGTDIMNNLSGMRGIIMFNVSGWGDAVGHFSYWDGSSVSYGAYFTPAQLHGATLNSVSIWLLD